MRIDGGHYMEQPSYNPAVQAAFGLRNDFVPSPISFSPRIGFSWTTGQTNEIAAFFGASRTPRAVIRGGISIFTNALNAGMINSALDNTGLPSGTQQLVCVGPAVPIDDWTIYAQNAGGVPSECADGTSGTVFSSASPNVSLISPNFTPQRTVRSNLSWNGNVLDNRFSLSVEGTYSLNLNRASARWTSSFPAHHAVLIPTMARPVYVFPTSIVPTTGSIASRDARVSTAFNRVNEVRSDLQSRTAQLQIRLNPITRTQNAFGWSATYTYTHIDEQYSGFTSTADNPLSVLWAQSGQGPHAINYSLRYSFFDAVHVNWTGTFRSGSRFTPMIAGDVNGDGYSNDRAFIYDPAKTVDSSLMAGMRDLLANTSGATRDCLLSQLGHIAERNSCKAPWSSTASLQVTLDRAKFRMPQRANVSFALSNPVGAADLLVNGSGNLKGWGMNVSPDPSLLYVRGFDPVTNRYHYEVNQRFGATRPQFITLRTPVVLTASFKLDLGPTRENQQLVQNISAGRSEPGSRLAEQTFRQQAANGLSNPLATIMRQQDSLHLTTLQADSIVTMNRRYLYRADSLWVPVARYFATLPIDFEANVAFDKYLDARHKQVDMLIEIAPTIHALLTDEQKRKLPQQVLNYLDSRYLISIRNGTGMYVNGTGASRGGNVDF